MIIVQTAPIHRLEVDAQHAPLVIFVSLELQLFKCAHREERGQLQEPKTDMKTVLNVVLVSFVLFME